MAYITEKTLIGEIVNTYPESIETLLSVGMHCLGCPASQAESLEEACGQSRQRRHHRRARIRAFFKTIKAERTVFLSTFLLSIH